MENNFWNIIWESLKRIWREDTVIKSIIWNNIIEIFNNEKKIDITSYLVSIKINWETIIVKTNKPAINFELNNIKDQIKKASIIKLKKLWFEFKDFDIKFV